MASVSHEMDHIERQDSHQTMAPDSSMTSEVMPGTQFDPASTALEAPLSNASDDDSSPSLPDKLRLSSKGNVSLACKNANHEPTTLEDYLDDPANDATSFYNLYNTEEMQIVKNALHRVDGMLSWYLMLQRKCQKVGAGWAVKSFIGPVVIGKAVWVGLRGIVDIGRDEEVAEAMQEAGIHTEEDGS